MRVLRTIGPLGLYQLCNLGNLSDRMKFSAGQNEILLVLNGRPAFFAKTVPVLINLKCHTYMYV